MTSMKQCTRCKEIKPTFEFSKSPKAKDGLHSYCKSCVAVYNREQRERNKLKNADRTEFPETKRCSACGVTKTSSEFSRSDNNADGLHGQCKSCTAEYRASNKLKNADRTEFPEFKRCYSCGQTKAGSEFSRQSNRADGLSSQCKSCNAEYRAANKLNRAVRKGYRKAVALGNHAEEFTGDDLEAHWAENDISAERCNYCGVELSTLEAKDQTLDHVHALNNGGPHTVENIVPCCGSCNSSKQDLELADWSIG
jgi:hypothetical protein